jgi:hypothetical protein
VEPVSDIGYFHCRGVHGEEFVTRFHRTGRGETIVLVHGVGAQASIWAPQIAALSERFDVNVFGREGLVLHGGTPVSKRKELVRRFQEDELSPFFVLSLKAGGAGLNLTAASHVVHFDRWWNPAAENQATDRAFRIGQSRNVLVHKFVCRGTVEDKIDQLIESKQSLVKDVLEGGTELQLTELSDRELLNLVALDTHSAQADV